MEHAARARLDDSHDTRIGPVQAASAGASEGIEKILRFATPPKTAEFAAARPATIAGPAGSLSARDFAAAIDGVHEARQAIEAADERTREADARGHALAMRAAEELRAAEGRIQALESRLRAAETRAADAETRAGEADAWLRQIFATIAQELPGRRPGAST